MLDGATAMIGHDKNATPEEHGKALAAMVGISLFLYLLLPNPSLDSPAWSVSPSIEPLRVDMVIW